MFLQIHTLTSFAAALLNRDATGLAKRIRFGNADRMRISSQCLKKHWRDELHRHINLPHGIRSRMFFEREILPRAINEGVSEDTAVQMIKVLIPGLIGKNSANKKNPLHLNQAVFFGKPEADYLVHLIVECVKNNNDPIKELETRLKKYKNNFSVMCEAAGIDGLVTGIEGALFGRFVTSDILAITDAPVHVAHAFTVHQLMNEFDYFVAVDDLENKVEQTGAAHIGEMELGAGLFYGYVVVDLPLLVSNLCGCKTEEWLKQPPEIIRTTRDVLTSLIQVITTVSPGAKLGATAPYSRAACMLLEVGSSQPRTLANAYLTALKLREDPLQKAVNVMGEHLNSLDEMYGRFEERFVSSTQNTDVFINTPRASVAESIISALNTVFGEL